MKTMSAVAGKKSPTFGIIGFGRFGQLWFECLKEFGTVLVYDKKKIAGRFGQNITFVTLRQVVNADVLFILVPISEFEKCCRKIKPFLPSETVVIDACSVKVKPVEIMKKVFPKNQPIIATHPLFGQNIVKKEGLKGQKIALCFLRCSQQQEVIFIAMLKKMGIKIIRTTPQQHDRQMAQTQALVHFLGRALARIHLEPQFVSTPNYQVLVDLNRSVGKDSWQLFLDMQRYNPFATKARRKLISAIEQVESDISPSFNFRVIKKIPTPNEIVEMFPLSVKAEQQIEKDKQEVKNILSGKDSRLLVVVGPCSAWPFDGVIEYAHRLKKVAEKLDDRLKIVMRTYIQKPRTTKGWTGPINQPDPFLPPDVEKGIRYCRNLMVKIIEMGLPIADEALFTHNAKGFMELLSWVAVGARSTEDQEHRIHASALDSAVGMKNPTSGSIEIGVNSIVAAQHGHTAVFNGYQIETKGNPFAHLILRGGSNRPNYSLEDLNEAKNQLEKQKVSHPAIIIDTSHDNCKVNGVKDPFQQITVVKDVMSTLKNNPHLKNLFKGFMIESFLESGCQKLETVTEATVLKNGLSVTDPCLGWKETEKLLLELASY